MKLFWSPTSPFVRKVMIAAHELGATNDIERVQTTPQTIVSDLSGDNPLAMIPTLITDAGETLYDSTVIITWLNHRYSGALVPPPGPGTWQAHRRHALVNGLLETANARFHEVRRPPEFQWPEQNAKLRDRIGRSLDALESEATALDGPFTFVQIATGAALGYLDLRFPDENWRSGRPTLDAWYAANTERPSFVATAPPST